MDFFFSHEGGETEIQKEPELGGDQSGLQSRPESQLGTDARISHKDQPGLALPIPENKPGF